MQRPVQVGFNAGHGMTDTDSEVVEIVKEVIRASFLLSWARDDELEPEAKAIARQLPRIRSHVDATAAIQRVFRSAFGDSFQLAEQELAFAGRLLALRLRAAGFLSSSLTLEGYSSDAILSLVSGELRATVFSGDPIVFEVGSAQVLGSFRIADNRIVAELAHIDGGGEGVLAFLSGLIKKFAGENGISTVEWMVHALTCAAPNARLRRALEHRGFVPSEHNGRPVLRLIEPGHTG